MRLSGKGSRGNGQQSGYRARHCGALRPRGEPTWSSTTTAAREAPARSSPWWRQPAARGLIVQADVSTVGGVRHLIDTAAGHFGELDILVNNAGVEVHAPFWEVTEDEYDRVLNVNLKGVFFATQAMVNHALQTSRPARVINISSVHEELPFPNFTAYCASKGGVKMLTRNLAVELGHLGVTVNAIAPGAIETPINTKLLNDPAKLNALLQQIPLARSASPRTSRASPCSWPPTMPRT